MTMSESPVRWLGYDNRTTGDPVDTRNGDFQVIGFDNRDFGDTWVAIAASSDVTEGKITPLGYFERQIVGYRAKDGSAQIADGYCPHLGVALHLGSMCEGNVRCGMHHWSFDPVTGVVCDIPYSDAKPNIAYDKFHVDEQAGFIFVWWPKENQDPTWVLPRLLEWNGFEFPEMSVDYRDFKVCLPDTLENAADFRHFGVVHDQFSNPGILELDHPEPHQILLTIDGGVASPQADLIASGLSGSETSQDQVVFEITSYGLCVTRSIISFDDGYLINLSFRTPLDRRSIRDWTGSSAVVAGGGPADPDVVRMVNEYSVRTLEEDIPFWETKRYPTARLVREDGPIMKYRRWVRQFHFPDSH